MDKLRMLIELAKREIKPVSQVHISGDKELGLIRDSGLMVIVESYGCGKRAIFGKAEHIGKYLHAKTIKEKGIAFGYPHCCAEYYEKFMEGKAKETPKKIPPLEHFVCPKCKESHNLIKKYKEILSRF